MSELHKRIKNRRIELGLTQDELAKKLGYKSRSSINKIESGKNDIPQSKISSIAKALNVSLLELLDLAPDDHDAIADIATKTHTHPAYITGKTDENNYWKYALEESINDLKYIKLKQSITQYNNDLQDAILTLWAYYINNFISDWYYESEKVTAKSLDTTYFLNILNDLYEDFRDYVNYESENFNDENDEDKSIVSFMESINRRKAKLVNTILDLLDTTISRTILNKDENVLIFLPEIINKYGDKKDK